MVVLAGRVTFGERRWVAWQYELQQQQQSSSRAGLFGSVPTVYLALGNLQAKYFRITEINAQLAGEFNKGSKSR